MPRTFQGVSLDSASYKFFDIRDGLSPFGDLVSRWLIFLVAIHHVAGGILVALHIHTPFADPKKSLSHEKASGYTLQMNYCDYSCDV